MANNFGHLNAAYATIDLDYNGEAQHSNNVFWQSSAPWGIVLPSNRQNLAGWNFKSVSGSVNPLEGLGGWTGKGTVASADGNMTIADLPGNYTAQPYYQSGPIIGQEYSITDSALTSSGNFGVAPSGGGDKNVKVRYDGSGWKISG
jgi:hypothetical protein